MAKTTDDLVKIVSYGGGVSIDAASKTTDDLVKIVSYAQTSAPVVILRNAGSKTTDDLVKIASYGKGKVILEL